MASVGANSTQTQLCNLVVAQEQLRDCSLARAVGSARTLKALRLLVMVDTYPPSRDITATLR